MRKRIFLHAFLLAGLAVAAPAYAETDQPPALISVTGEAHVSVPPDLAQIDAGVTSEAKTAREASDANNAAMGKVLLALKGAGIDEKDFQTSRLSLQAENSIPKQGAPSTIIGYRASNRVTIRLRDVTKVAGVIDTLVSAGANDIGGINFMVSRASKLLDDAREQAIADHEARLHHIDDRALGLAVAGHFGDRLMQVRVELAVGGIDRLHAIAFERRKKLALRRVDAASIGRY